MNKVKTLLFSHCPQIEWNCTEGLMFLAKALRLSSILDLYQFM